MDISDQLKVETIEHAPWVEPLVVSPTATLREAISLMRRERVGAVVVCREARAIGIVTERDVLKQLARETNLSACVESLMSGPCVTVYRDTTMAAAIRLMNKGGYRRLPIVSADGAPIGVITVSGILHYLVQFFPKLVYNLQPRPQAVLSEREGP